MRKPTVHDIVRVSGYSLATVDRVLNRRAGVRPATIEAVEETVRKIGYVRDISAANLASGRIYRITFILPSADSSFLSSLRAEVEQRQTILRAERVELSLKLVPQFDGKALAKALSELSKKTSNSIVIVGTDHPDVPAQIARLAAEGVPTLTLVSDLPSSGRLHYIGIANTAAGRAAASLLGRFLPKNTPAKLAVMAGSLKLKDHRDRLKGFQAVLEAEFPNVTIVAVLEGQDSEDTTFKLLSRCLKDHPDLAGLYSLGAGNRGVVSALKEAKGPPIRIVAHELTTVARAALEEGLFDAVLHQSPYQEVGACIRLSKSLIDGTPFDPADAEIRTEIFLRDTMPPETSLGGREKGTG